MIHIEGGRVTGQGGKHKRSSTMGVRSGPEWIHEGSPTEIVGNVLGGKRKDEGETY